MAEEPRPAQFSIPAPHPAFRFPKDNGSHPQYRIEWWYVAGHLFGDSDTRFSLQATFFRLGHENEHYFLSHTALGDISRQSFLFDERLGVGGISARAGTDRLDIRLGDWSLSEDSESDRLLLDAGVGANRKFRLSLHPLKPRVFFGEEGHTVKDTDSSVSSYYISCPRLAVEGDLRFHGTSFPVNGEAWMDHEIASRQLGDEQTGWDWIQMQFRDGWEMTAYRIRYEDDRPSFTAMTWIAPDGDLIQVDPGEFSWKANGLWVSPVSGASYPLAPTLVTCDPRTGQSIRYTFQPLQRNQELRGSKGTVYWEGAGDIVDGNGHTVARSFLELTGYAGRLSRIVR